MGGTVLARPRGIAQRSGFSGPTHSQLWSDNVDKFVKFPSDKAEIAGLVVLILVTMAVAARTPVLKKVI